ncbi:MAG TPA: hypothetical protein VFT32_08870 [Candidatus Eisenbacteria bacterium]|nr:hypothetical protein [Candidatus Eisenbacteria bacterium]
MIAIRFPRTKGLSLAVLLLLVVAGIAGCGEDSSAGKDLQVSNQQDTFQFQVTDMKHYSHTYTYTWANSGASASVNQACSITGGTATLVLRDGNGASVYAQSLKANGTFNTTAGAPGNWTVQVLVNDVSGTLNFRAQKL